MNKTILGIALTGGLLATGIAGSALASDQLRTQDRLHTEDRIYTQDRVQSHDRFHLKAVSDDGYEYQFRDGAKHMVQERAEYRYRVLDGGTSMGDGSGMNGGASGNGGHGMGKGR